MLRRIEVDEHARHLEVGTVLGEDRTFALGGEVLPLPVHLHAIGVTRYDPEAVLRLLRLHLTVAEHRRFLTQAGEELVRNAVEVGVVTCDVDLVDEAHGCLPLVVNCVDCACWSDVWRAVQPAPRINPLVGTPVPAVTRTCST